ncbi:response regulator [Desulfobulbus elongatus]|uniref:response regulator n=1 Tax=Desulfobulbus elongatus TaxID=53332 RepID=UPI0004816DFA|nr:response regulator [Desulfobulbus elongatus]
MTKKSILFVDDEPNILAGLKRTFRSMRNDKDLHFVESGQEALDFMADHPVDVIVSDMRMPGMDGATLLTTIQRQYPHVIRIMLTGQADEESILRTVDVVHQFITKPSDPETLKQVLERACALQNLMQNEHLQALAASIGSLPSLPPLYARLCRKLKEPDSPLSEIGKIIEQDLGMSAKILQLVNSSFFGFFKNIDSPSRAVNLLGLDTVKALVLSVGVFSELNPMAAKSFSAAALWRHSVAVAAYAKRIAVEETGCKELIEQAFIAGFMHDVGKLLLFSTVRDKYIEATELAQIEQVAHCQAEYQIFSATHGDVGGYLLGLWGLTGPIVDAAAFHHRLAHYPKPSLCTPLIVHAADIIYHLLNPQQQYIPPALDTTFLEQAGKAGRFEHWLEVCRQLDPIELP